MKGTLLKGFSLFLVLSSLIANSGAKLIPLIHSSQHKIQQPKQQLDTEFFIEQDYQHDQGIFYIDAPIGKREDGEIKTYPLKMRLDSTYSWISSKNKEDSDGTLYGVSCKSLYFCKKVNEDDSEIYIQVSNFDVSGYHYEVGFFVNNKTYEKFDIILAASTTYKPMASLIYGEIGLGYDEEKNKQFFQIFDKVDGSDDDSDKEEDSDMSDQEKKDSKNTFSIYIGQGSNYGNSTIIAGTSEYDSTYIKPGHQKTVVNISRASTWSVPVPKIVLRNSTTKTTTVKLADGVARFDASLSRIELPSDVYDVFTDRLNLRCHKNAGIQIFYCECDEDREISDDVPDLYFFFDEQEFRLPAEQYTTKNGSSCHVNITRHKQSDKDTTDHVVLGSPFMQYYYMTFNYSQESKSISFAIANPNPGDALGPASKIGSSTKVIIIMSVGLVLACGVVFLCSYCMKKVNKQNNTSTEDYQRVEDVSNNFQTKKYDIYQEQNQQL